MIKKEILFVVLSDFTDWEGAYCAPYLNYGCGPDIESKYVVKTVSVTKSPLRSCGGFTILPDYSLEDMPADYAGLVLIGGMRWFSPELEFSREILFALDAYPPKLIEKSYRMNKTGVWEAPETL